VTLVTVSAIGNPIRFKPTETDYIIEIYELEHLQGDNIDADMIQTGNPIVSFTISQTVDPRDLERSYGKIIREYIINRPAPPVFRNFQFRGPCAVQQYEKAFQALIKAILTVPKRTDEAECAHVGRRLKKK
jgi:hypothetical protein